jgi:competence protein ComEC
LEKIRPRIAAISVGAHNDYKHPAAQTIRRLEAVHARILRTDLEGELILVSDGKRVTVVEEHQ